jgi:hypothetical protein
MAPSAPSRPPLPLSLSPAPASKRGLGRRGQRAADQARQKWVAYYSPWVKLLASKEIEKELAKPKEEQDQEKLAKLRDAAVFTPYVRPVSNPKVRHKRGADRRLHKRLLSMVAEMQGEIPIMPENFDVTYIPPPTVQDAITGPKC